MNTKTDDYVLTTIQTVFPREWVQKIILKKYSSKTLSRRVRWACCGNKLKKKSGCATFFHSTVSFYVRYCWHSESRTPALPTIKVNETRNNKYKRFPAVYMDEKKLAFTFCRVNPRGRKYSWIACFYVSIVTQLNWNKKGSNPSKNNGNLQLCV